MKYSMKATLTAVMLSSVALVPAAAVSLMATADVAYAKSDKAGGNGNGNGNAGNRGNSGNNGKSGDRAAKSNGKSGDKKSASRGASKSLKSMIRSVTGQDKKATKRRSSGKVRLAKTDPMHPSNLGNMNGALNANINAVLAHIVNGNTNGPVGHLAALAVANVNAEGAQEIVDLEEDFARS